VTLRPRERLVMTAAEKQIAGRDHGRRVGRARYRAPGGEIDISLPCHVEGVIAAACQLAGAQVQRGAADRTAQMLGDCCESAAPFGGRRYAAMLMVRRIAWVHRGVPSSRKDDQPTAVRSDTRAR
jgi:hypothetical protein